MVSVTSVEVWPLSAALLSVSEAAELVSELVSELALPAEEEDSVVDRRRLSNEGHGKGQQDGGNSFTHTSFDSFSIK